MKKIIILIMSTIFVFGCNIVSNPCNKINEETLKDEFKKAFHIDFEKVLEKNEVKGTNLCQIVIEKGGNFGVFYAAPDNKTFFIGGDIYREGKFLTRLTLDRIQEKKFEAYKEEIEKVVAFSFKPEGASKYIYMITDPDCPFCEKAKSSVREWANSRKIEVKVILFPLQQIHPQAREKTIRGICSGMTYEDYLNSKWEGKSCDRGLEKINKTVELMRKISVDGTPTFISYNGKRMVGFSEEGLNRIIE